MKNFQSITEGVWIELLNIELTTEQKAIMTSNNEEAKRILMQSIMAQREGLVLESKVTTLTTFYNTIKPVLEETDVYQLIAINLSETVENVFTGILNYRVNSEHRQIRF